MNRRALLGGALAAPAEQVRLALPELGDDAVLLGASEAVWQRVLLDPAGALAGPAATGDRLRIGRRR